MLGRHKAQSGSQMSLAHAGWAKEHHVLRIFQEAHGGQFIDLRACLISQRVWIGERIFCPARQKSAGILTDGKDF